MSTFSLDGRRNIGEPIKGVQDEENMVEERTDEQEGIKNFLFQFAFQHRYFSEFLKRARGKTIAHFAPRSVRFDSSFGVLRMTSSVRSESADTLSFAQKASTPFVTHVASPFVASQAGDSEQGTPSVVRVFSYTPRRHVREPSGEFREKPPEDFVSFMVEVFEDLTEEEKRQFLVIISPEEDDLPSLADGARDSEDEASVETL